MKQRLISDIGQLLGVLLLATVLWVLQYELHAPNYHDIVQHVTTTSRLNVLSAVFLTVLGALALVNYNAFVVPFRPISLLLFRQVFRSGTGRGSALVNRTKSPIASVVGTLSHLGGFGVVQRTGRVAKLTRILHNISQWLSALTPRVLACSVLLYATMLLFFGETLPVINWWPWFANMFVSSVPLFPPFFGSVIAMALLPLARGLYQRVDAAYHFILGLLGASAVYSFFISLAYIPAVSLSIMLAVTLRCRAQFYRTATFLTERSTVRWSASITMVVLALLWLGVFASTGNEYAQEPWWHVVINEDAPFLLRIAIATLTGTVLIFTTKLLSSPALESAPLDQTDLDLVHSMVRQSQNTTAHLALLGDKHLLFNDIRTAFIMYRIEGRSWVACSDPVGPKEEVAALIWRFHELCDQHHGWTVFYQVSPAYLPLYLDLGLSLLKLGEEARIPLATFSLDGKARKPFRYVCNRLEKDQCVFEIIPAHAVQPLLPELRGISDSWLATKNRREKGFSLGFFDPAYLQRYPTAIVRKQEKIVAFANLWSSNDKGELSPDLMRYLPDISADVMEYLLIKLMLWGKHEGYRWFNLGMAPLSGLESRTHAPLWNQLGAFVFRHGEPFYNFQGLRRYKEKFDPIWEPRYLAVPKGVGLPRILMNVTTLISSGATGVIRK